LHEVINDKDEGDNLLAKDELDVLAEKEKHKIKEEVEHAEEHELE
jgi:folate-dependent phosphoribosylglycinamide formyltransferase PurN